MLPPKLQSILDDLALAPDRADRIEALIALGHEFANPAPADFPRTEDRRVPGCESEAFVSASSTDGRWSFRYAVDNPQGISAMALARILEQGLDGASVTEVRAVPDELIYDIFGTELSMGKSLGLMNMIRVTKALAR